MNDYSDNNAGDLCEITLVDARKVLRAREHVPPEERLQEQADRFKLLGDPTRLRILHALSAEELCVCDLATLLDSSPSAVSHQLRLLRAARLVRFRKSGKMVYYALADPQVRILLKVPSIAGTTGTRQETRAEER
jgi:DNA-binding transcriptional ArsR family regulator